MASSRIFFNSDGVLWPTIAAINKALDISFQIDESTLQQMSEGLLVRRWGILWRPSRLVNSDGT